MRWRTIARNVVSNWASYLVTVMVGFLLAPFILHRLGNTGYGLWTLVLSVTGYFGLLDMGIRSSVGRYVARYLALDDRENVNRTVTAAMTILSAAGLLTLLLTGVVALFFFDSLQVQPQFASSARTALVIAGFTVAAMLPLGVCSSVLIALERYDVLSGVTSISEITRAVLVVFCLSNGYGLVGLALVSLLVSLSQYGVYAFCAKRLYPSLQISPKLFTRSSAKDLFSFGAYRFAWITGYQLIFYSQSLLIGYFLGADYITFYVIAGSLINYSRNVVSLATDTLAPASARMDAVEDRAGLQNLLIFGTRLALLLVVPLCLGLVFFGKAFISLWMGPDYAGSSVFLSILTISLFAGTSQYVSVLIISSMARHRVLAYAVLAEGVVNIGLSILLLRHFGLAGVAWGTVLPNLISMGIVVPLYTFHILQVSPGKYLSGAFLRPLLCAIPAAASAYVMTHLVPHPSWAVFAGQAATMCSVFALTSLFVCFTPSERAAMLNKISSFLNREPVVHEV